MCYSPRRHRHTQTHRAGLVCRATSVTSVCRQDLQAWEKQSSLLKQHADGQKLYYVNMKILQISHLSPPPAHFLPCLSLSPFLGSCLITSHKYDLSVRWAKENMTLDSWSWRNRTSVQTQQRAWRTCVCGMFLYARANVFISVYIIYFFLSCTFKILS